MLFFFHSLALLVCLVPADLLLWLFLWEGSVAWMNWDAYCYSRHTYHQQWGWCMVVVECWSNRRKFMTKRNRKKIYKKYKRMKSTIKIRKSSFFILDCTIPYHPTSHILTWDFLKDQSWVEMRDGWIMDDRIIKRLKVHILNILLLSHRHHDHHQIFLCCLCFFSFLKSKNHCCSPRGEGMSRELEPKF